MSLSGEQTEVRQMSCALLQTVYEGEDQDSKYAGPRMLYRHPILSGAHYLAGK